MIFRVNKLIYQRVIPNITLTWLVTLGVDVIGFLVRFPGDDSAACACLWLMGFTLPAVGGHHEIQRFDEFWKLKNLKLRRKMTVVSNHIGVIDAYTGRVRDMIIFSTKIECHKVWNVPVIQKN